MQNTVILGAGFAALTAVKSLRKQGYRDKITLLAPKAEFVYYPSLIWVPAGWRTETDIKLPLANFFKRHAVEYQQASVTGLRPEASIVETDQGEFDFDKLIIASGGRFIKKLPGIDQVFIPCEGYESTRAYSDRLAEMTSGTLAFGFGGNPKEPSAMRGGPIFEFMFGIDTLLRQQGRREQFDLLFFSPAPQPGKRMGAKAVDGLLMEMKNRQIHTHLGHKIKGFEAHKIKTEGGEERSDLTLFMPGMTGPAWAANSGLPLTAGGFINADEHCKTPDFDNIYVAGDAGSFPGPDWKPKQAHMADLQAKAAVTNLLAEMQGEAATHTFKTELICIVDSLNNGIMVYRDEKRAWHFKLVVFQWLKRLFEWFYLRDYR
ncbi:NAD(P)/FAD-dependent oxidoreductase [Candidatus Venteria ishoeyi]|uniref:NADH dehydrogenase-like protein n=1 Tax=Candidatus Venteria ishoeyi TaxID=1899563 RepID=A0A1H6F4D9_9GAMM|nr:FAD-dependent oxidoreductase [Candidatus Venteria ishoeyi]MDM8545803.1 FAD-dependent oxidoreductase [Candidatus Venteria ishoeyi]SEH04962.1 NADH dehydrogenase-like protein [Candidatus Venteria ishoeyi]